MDTRFENISQARIFGSVIPAPNPTGELHLGHVLNLTIQDVLCRWNLRLGAKIYWSAALDHGATATEYVVERNRRQSGSTLPLSEQDIRAWVDHTSPKIYAQLGRLNLILDSSLRRSMGDCETEKQFERLIDHLKKSGVIYQAAKVVPWCPVRKTSVDAADVVYQTRLNTSYDVEYRIEAPGDCCFVVRVVDLATLENDAALLVNPDHFLFKILKNPIAINPLGKRIPIYPGSFAVKSASTTAAFRITPGHCSRSFGWACRNLAEVGRAFDENGIMSVGKYTGCHRKIASRYICRDILRGGGKCDRVDEVKPVKIFRLSDYPVEEFLTKQVFADLSKMARDALVLISKSEIKIFPRECERLLQLYFEEIVRSDANDGPSHVADHWCVSHQTIWGTHFSTSGVVPRGLSLDRLPNLSEIQTANMRLSCALWAFCANCVYANTKTGYRRLADASVCVTGIDLLYFWIAPILMLSTVLPEGLPFRTAIIHPLVCDALGQKMSKSAGNVLLPDELIDRYGSDAVRLGMLFAANLHGTSVAFNEDTAGLCRHSLDGLKAAFSVRDRNAPDSGVYLMHCVSDLRRHFETAISTYDFNSCAARTIQIVDSLAQYVRGGGELHGAWFSRSLDLIEPFVPALAEEIRAKLSARRHYRA